MFASGIAKAAAATVAGLALWAMAPGPLQAAELNDVAAVPLLGEAGKAGYGKFLAADPHRAFAIATGGVWAWASGHASAEDAAAAAVADCAQYTNRKCLPYAIDDRIVFDAQAWAASWGPYLSAAEAAAAATGVMTGNRFPDLVLTAPDGRPIKLSDLKGRVVLLHFWGSWCPPCQAEFPELQKLHDVLKDSPDIVFVPVQTREPIAKSRRWAKRRGISMPLYDSGAKARKDTILQLAGGGIEDRRLAPIFPSTYVLDTNGIVVFGHAGPASDWPGYEPLLRHVMKAAGAS